MIPSPLVVESECTVIFHPCFDDTNPISWLVQEPRNPQHPYRIFFIVFRVRPETNPERFSMDFGAQNLCWDWKMMASPICGG